VQHRRSAQHPTEPSSYDYGTMSRTDEDLLELTRTVVTIREFELKVRELVAANEIAGVTHEYIGQEGVAAGVCHALTPHDYITSTHRGHGHSIAKGASLTGMFAELLGRDTGLNKGRGGSMHVASVANGVLGANGIVGAGVPFALGAAWSAKMRGSDAVAVAFFGDGGSNQGVTLESMNLAALWKLPVLFACENNQYAVSMRSGDAIAGDLLTRARGFGLSAAECDGMSPEQVLKTVREVLPSIRAGEPSFVEFQTYRFVGHHTAERLTYREDSEVEVWRSRDPVQQLARALGTDRFDGIKAKVRLDIDEALSRARQGPVPAPETARNFMYATNGMSSGWTA
jgi:acetoin:2,6-dichlorophenolindophenol oxidoreductase subunit alpha